MNHTIYLNYTTGQTLYAYPQGQSLTDWATYRVVMAEGVGDNTGRYAATVDDTNGDVWLIFSGAAQPADWTVAISEPVDVGAAKIGSAMTLADNAITAAKYDEATAFPLKSDDSGATQVARTGADGDTLETLSDELAVVDANVDTVVSRTAGGVTVTVVSPVATDGLTLDLVRADDYT